MNKRVWIILPVLALGLAFSGFIGTAAAAAAAPEEAVDDYSALFKLLPGEEELRAPTAEEIRKLGPLWPTVPPEKNAVYYFVKANAGLLERCKQLPEPPGSASQEKPYAGDAADFARYVKENATVVTTFHEGLNQHALQFPWLIIRQSGTPGPALPILAHIRNLARFVTDAGFAAELEGKPDAAAERYLECIWMGHKLQEDSVLVAQLVAVAVQKIGSANLDSLIANSSLNKTTLKLIIELSRERETTPKSRLAVLQRETEFTLTMVAVSPALARTLGKDYNEFVAAMTKELAKPLPELLRTAKDTAEKWKGTLQEGNALVLLERLPQQWAVHDLDMRMLQVRAAIALYQRQHAALPENLDALVPGFLPAVPEDPFTGKPLRYARTEGGWKLWSAGYDLKDDGGEAAIVDEKGSVGPDFVYTEKVRSNIERRSKGAIKNLPVVAPEPRGEGRTKYDTAMDLHRTGKFAEAIAAYKEFIGEKEFPALVPIALYKIGLCHIGLDQNAEAKAAFRKVIDGYPETDFAKWAAEELQRLEKKNLPPGAK